MTIRKDKPNQADKDLYLARRKKRPKSPSEISRQKMLDELHKIDLPPRKSPKMVPKRKKGITQEKEVLLQMKKPLGLGPMGQKMADKMKNKSPLGAALAGKSGKGKVEKKRGGGKVGHSIKTYSNGGYVEGK